eukprot:RCo008903
MMRRCVCLDDGPTADMPSCSPVDCRDGPQLEAPSLPEVGDTSGHSLRFYHELLQRFSIVTVEDLCRSPAMRDPINLQVTEHRHCLGLCYGKDSDSGGDPWWEGVLGDCRGVFVSKADLRRVVCMGFRRFFDHFDPRAAPLDWSREVVVQKKLDGTLLKLYWSEPERNWVVATSRCADAHRCVRAGTDFAAKFFDFTGQALQLSELCPSKVYVFELVLSSNLPREQRVQHLATVCLRTGLEEFPCRSIGIRQPLIYHLPSLAKCEELLSGLDSIEGLVAKQPVHRSGATHTGGLCEVARVKVKAPAYVTRHYGLYRLQECCTAADWAREGWRLLATREEREFEAVLAEQPRSVLGCLRVTLAEYCQSLGAELRGAAEADWASALLRTHIEKTVPHRELDTYHHHHHPTAILWE